MKRLRVRLVEVELLESEMMNKSMTLLVLN